MHWLPNQDCFTYKLQASIPTGSTKREILSSIARLFDPLGLIAPILISAKLILKEVTMAHLHSENDRKHLGWDDPVPSSIANKWKKFRVNLEDISKIRIPRSVRYTPDFSLDIQLHAFCDGSTHAYAAAVYMRIPQPDSSFYTTLITAKSKISPTKPLTIPFVANRVAYILDHSDSNQWRHVPTADNPAGSATRGLSPSEISIFDLWWHGPAWLRQHSSEWPDTEVPNIKFDEQSLEAKSLQIRLHTTQVDINLIERFSTYTKLVRVIAYILRFCHNAQSKKTRSYSQLSPEELDNALRCVVKIVQAEDLSIRHARDPRRKSSASEEHPKKSHSLSWRRHLTRSRSSQTFQPFFRSQTSNHLTAASFLYRAGNSELPSSYPAWRRSSYFSPHEVQVLDSKWKTSRPNNPSKMHHVLPRVT